MPDGFYHWFSKRLLTGFGSPWRGRIEQSGLALLQAAASPSSDILETGLTPDLLAADALLANRPGLDVLSRDPQTEGPPSRIQKNLFETPAFISRKPAP